MSWELWRQDEHGNEFLIRAFEDRARAEDARDDFIARGHHQHYWVNDTRSVGATTTRTTPTADRSHVASGCSEFRTPSEPSSTPT